jgi:mono/diheme cytochrome c family protein
LISRFLLATALGLIAFALGLRASGEWTEAASQKATVSSVWNGVYTGAQADRGKSAYETQCSFCHLSDLRGQGFAPPLIEDAFLQRWSDGNLGDLFTIVKLTMPQDKPASLGDREYADIVAYLLKANQYPAGQQELAPEPAALKEVTFKRPAER